MLFYRLQVSNAKRRDPLIAPFIQMGDRPEVTHLPAVLSVLAMHLPPIHCVC